MLAVLLLLVGGDGVGGSVVALDVGLEVAVLVFCQFRRWCWVFMLKLMSVLGLMSVWMLTLFLP